MLLKIGTASFWFSYVGGLFIVLHNFNCWSFKNCYFKLSTSPVNRSIDEKELPNNFPIYAWTPDLNQTSGLILGTLRIKPGIKLKKYKSKHRGMEEDLDYRGLKVILPDNFKTLSSNSDAIYISKYYNFAVWIPGKQDKLKKKKKSIEFCYFSVFLEFLFSA